MKLTFLGAAREVTGSRFYLEACGRKMLVDYGMEQGANVYENTPLPVAAGEIDFVFLTHAHIDHSGWLPLLVKQGFKGQIFTTQATADLCSIMLQDSAHIQEMDAEWKNRKAQRSGRGLVEPLYTTQDAMATAKLFAPVEYNRAIPVCEGITIRMVDVGHLLGSASIELNVTEDGKTQKLVFSGDVGNVHQPLLRDPSYMTEADYVVMESTYGDRSHGERPDYIGELTKVLQSTFDRGGNVVIPSFAVGRTQELLYFIRTIKQEQLVKGHDDFPVYVDSPLAVEATNIFNEHMLDCMDDDTLALVKAGVNPIRFDNLRVSVTSDDSKLINEDPTPKVILSASGMCDAGRIRHHLKHNLWRPECTVLFVGYQSEGTLGRILLEGAKEVKIFGEPISVAASIRTLSGISGHADQAGLLKWIGSFTTELKHVFIVHGEDSVAEGFAKRLHDDLHLNASAPYNGESWDLTACELIAEGNKQKLERKAPEEANGQAESGSPANGKLKLRQAKPSSSSESQAYGELLTAFTRLGELVEQMRGEPKKQQSKLGAALYTLLKKFGK